MKGHDVERTFTRDRSSGRIHLRLKVNGVLQSAESDNLDAAGDFDVVDESVLETAEPGQLCERCFPKDGET